MISKIDIQKFGLFKDFSWNETIGNQETFRKLNIIYGRNYSGKTTLSRIFKCLENRVLHKDYLDGKFNVSLSTTEVITEMDLEGLVSYLRIYNSDFVRTNLSWLHHQDGSIEPFTILGEKNVELEGKITEINDLLGDETSGGMIQQHLEKEAEMKNVKESLKLSIAALEGKLRSKANDDIKTDSNLFIVTSHKKTYNIADINSEIVLIQDYPDTHIIPTQDTADLAHSLKENVLMEISPLKEAKPNFIEYFTLAGSLIEQKIRPSAVIADLIGDSVLQEWVRNGIELHKDKRENCGFCGEKLDEKLWEKLGAHFNKESESLRNDIEMMISKLERAKESITTFLTLKKGDFYIALQTDFSNNENSWILHRNGYISDLELLIERLKQRQNNIFYALDIPEIADRSEDILTCIKTFNLIVKKHNLKSGTLVADQLETRRRMRFSTIAQFIKDINYVNISSGHTTERKVIERLEEITAKQKEEIGKLLETRRVLETQAKDESRGAELINRHLSHFFGHQELKLVSEGASPQIRFIIKRDGHTAYNLSEGECSLISFCYFIAKIQDELNDVTIAKNLIIYIDDPISSLDCNHIFFMYSLIEDIIAKPKKYGQLFISTHNLDFLKYIKHLTHDNYKPQENSKNKKADRRYFMIERVGKGKSILKDSPAYLSHYVTEFNYLFHQIYKCATGSGEINTDYHYNFGNNLRKFLEAHTFYRYPSHKMSFTERLTKYFANDQISMLLVFRLINEYSHLEDQFDRAMVPIDLSEITTIANVIIDKLRVEDEAQFDALIESIDA